MIQIEDFNKLDIRIGTIINAKINEKAQKAAYKLDIDFGPLGIKKSSAQITKLYKADALIGKQVVAIVNLPARQIANVISEVLILGCYDQDGVVLLSPDQKVTNGVKIG